MSLPFRLAQLDCVIADRPTQKQVIWHTMRPLKTSGTKFGGYYRSDQRLPLLDLLCYSVGHTSTEDSQGDYLKYGDPE